MKPIHQQTDEAKTVEFFTQLLASHPTGPEALNWGSKSSQELRFKILSEIGIPLGASVLDVGCGLGDFFNWQRQIGLNLRYHGIDITPSMVEKAGIRFPEASFAVGNLINEDSDQYDYVIASGIFYLQQTEPQKYLEQTVEKLFTKARIGLAFNSLSRWSNQREEGEFYADPLETLNFCRRLTPYVSLRHDYHPGDFTIHMRHLPKNQ
jgi:SAM-dependent methyltransferase